jgi:hypothetical protein
MERKCSMRRIALLAGVLGSLAFASQAAAATAGVSVSMTLAEPIQPGLVSGCPISPMDGLCGSGEVIPFGHATDTVIFGAGTCPGCDQRTINLPEGSLIFDELFSNPTCPVCGIPGRGQPAAGTVSDKVLSGTGIFAGASGRLSGHVHAAGTAGITKLSGTLILAS